MFGLSYKTIGVLAGLVVVTLLVISFARPVLSKVPVLKNL